MNELVVQVVRAPLAVQTLDQALVMVEHAYAVLGQALDFQQTREVQNLAVAAAAYAREAGDTRLLSRCTELRTRAQRKAGQMLTEAAEKGQRARSGVDTRYAPQESKPATLAEIGITRDQSSKWQKVGALKDHEFEAALAMTKAVTAEVSADKVLRADQRRTVEVADDDTVLLVEVEPLSADEQATSFYNAVRDLAALTLTAPQLQAALPYYQHFRIAERIGPACALLQKVKDSWTSKN